MGSAFPPVVRVFRESGDEALYHVPNEVTLGRCQTLFTKEPVTIDWIDSMRPGEVLYDVGANVGMYSVWAGKRGVKCYAFEPESENYALLCKNLALNKITNPAYCLAIGSRMNVDRLYLSTQEVGRSCHTFGDPVGPNLQPREGPSQGSVCMSIDELVKAGLPVPNYIKIDVDGLEHKVITGAQKTLSRPELKSVLVELNPAMPQHQTVIKFFEKLGWYLDPVQVAKATRQGGEWKGYAEHLFHKLSTIAEYTLDKIRGAEVRQEPFPHLYVEEVFHPAVYKMLRERLPADGEYIPIDEARGTKGYPARSVAYPRDPLWRDLQQFMRSGALRQALCEKLGVEGTKDETLLIRDAPGYKIGPHTDAPVKRLSALFYMPGDASLSEHGTSLYTPKAEGFTCQGLAHHSFADFNKVATMPFLPNAMFAFAKSDRSFHGVEPFDAVGVRDVLLYDVRA